MLAGVLPTPAVALLALDLGVVISASHNPPEYNGVKFFDEHGSKLTDASEEEIEALLDAPARGGGTIDRVDVYTESYLDHVLERFGTDLTASGSRSTARTAPTPGSRAAAFERLGAEVTAIGGRAERENINEGCGATDLALLQQTVREAATTSASPSTATATGCSRSTATATRRRRPDPRDPRPPPRRRRRRRDRDDEPRLPPPDGRARHPGRHDPVGDRYVLEALRRENGSSAASSRAT